MHTLDTDTCTHCHLCRDSCAFLDKYGIDIGDVERLDELAYHCFLCGTCTRVCPEHIDGREVVLSLRRQQVQAVGKAPKGYGGVIHEKRDYLFKNYRHTSGSKALFPGCNFPSLFPKTLRTLMDEYLPQAGVGIVFDCCGKPVAELGLQADEERLVTRLERNLIAHGINEIYVLCPNCYYYLKPRLSLTVTSLYENRALLGIDCDLACEGSLFLPCPDRMTHEFLATLPLNMSGGLNLLTEPQCCGAGGCGGVAEPELARVMAENAGRNNTIYTYCATCSGALARNGASGVRHLLPELLGTHEKPDTARSFVNRVRTKLV